MGKKLIFIIPLLIAAIFTAGERIDLSKALDRARSESDLLNTNTETDAVRDETARKNAARPKRPVARHITSEQDEGVVLFQPDGEDKSE